MLATVKKRTHEDDSQYLCTGCGTCAGVCPGNAIDMKFDRNLGIYLPCVNKDQCSECGLCIKVCPGPSVDFTQLNKEIFARLPINPYLGNLSKCYTGHSTNHEIRYEASSGGVITSLLLFALKEGLIDGALVTKTENDDLKPQPLIAHTPEEILSATKSKYCPTPTNMALKRILKEKGHFAAVGLPCQTHGIRMAQNAMPELKEKIVLVLGLFCSHNVNFQGTVNFLHRMKVDLADVQVLHYRGGGWPGKPMIRLKNGGNLRDTEGVWNAMFTPRFFTPQRCMTCCDPTNELADISFGDPWLPKFRNERTGKSLIIARTDNGNSILKQAQSQYIIQLEPITDNEVKQSQGTIHYKKHTVTAMTKLQSVLHPTPNYQTPLFSPSLLDTTVALILFFNVQLSSKRSLNSVLDVWSKLLQRIKPLAKLTSVTA
jgi:coenzyme F420 hydrogenase subunit beta